MSISSSNIRLRKRFQSRIVSKPLLSPRQAKKPVNPFLTALASSRQSDVPIDPHMHSERGWSHDPRLHAIPLPSDQNKSLHLKGVPDELNNEQYLLNHFNKYGPVDNIKCEITKKYADIHFKTRESAVLAKKQGGILLPNTRPVTIFWYSTKASVPKKNKPRDDDTDYDPCVEEQEDDDDYDDNEVVNEGADSILHDRRSHDDDDAMDTIVRSANHPYYLRSLHQPDKDSEDSDIVSSYQRYNIPVLVLPPVQSVKGFASAVECFEVLDQRDKMMRKSLTKDTSLRAELIVGTCPDMCPEKERYEREYQRRLSSFEVSSEGGVDHTKAVKEYSRSAADKEEPLPHELRPLSVLLMTMDYLCTCIIDQIEDSNDCYQFVWDRTRAITTDITYQQLCEIDCVLIIERCVRFHILCRFILCERDIQSFDPKMNDESLARHLQSLRQLYKDLKTQNDDVALFNEPEMCCYDILLHCTDGNVLNTIEGYSQSVRQSGPVMFAIRVVQAIESNNFVKFFKLVKYSDFLSACLLHRCFNLIRMRALKTLNNSHSPGVDKAMHFNLLDLSRILGFANREEAGMFCQEVGLHVSREKVQLQRGIEVTLPTGIMMDEMVMMKNDISFAEVVYGGPLPPVPDHTPYCSFTANPQPSTDTLPTTIIKDTPSINIDEISLEVIEDVIMETVLGEAPSLVDDIIHTLLMNDVAILLNDDLINGLVGVSCKEIAQTIILEELNKRNKQEENEIKGIITNQMSALYLEDVIRELCNAVAMETIADRGQLILKCTDELMSVLLEETLKECVHETVLDTVNVLWTEKKQRLESLSTEIDRKQLAKYWERWSHALSSRQYIINAVAQFPPSVSHISLHDQVILMNNSTPFTRKLDHDPYTTVHHHHDSSHVPIDMHSLLLTHLPLPDTTVNDTVMIYWNILVITDMANESSTMWTWLKDRLKINTMLDSDSMSIFKPIINLKFCLYNELSSLMNDEFFDVPVVVMVTVPMPQANELPQHYTDHVIKSLPSLCWDHPTVILTPYKLSFLYVVQLLKGINHNRSPVDVSGIMYKDSELQKVLVWLIEHTPPPSVSIVEWIDVHQYLYNGISSRFYQYVIPELHSVSLNQRPEVVVGFYNDVLMNLVKQIEVGVVTVSKASSVYNTHYSSWKHPISDLRPLVMGLRNLQLPSIASLSCVEYINNFIISDSVSRARLLSLLTVNNQFVSPWVHVLLICTELLLLSTKETFSNLMIGVPPPGDNDDHAPLHWIHEILTCDTGVDSRKRRRSDLPTELITSAPPTKAPSTFQSSLHDLKSTIERETQLQDEYEKQLKVWSQEEPIVAIPTDTVSNTSSTQNEKWLNTITSMKLSVLQTRFVKKDPGF